MNTTKIIILLLVSLICFILLTKVGRKKIYENVLHDNNKTEGFLYKIKDDDLGDYYLILSNTGIKDSATNYIFKKGLKFVENEEYQKAKDCFEAADKIYPNNAVILNALGLAIARTENPYKAFLFFEKALNSDSNFIMTYINYGACLNKVGLYQKAAVIFRLGLSKQSKSDFDRRFLYSNLALTYYYGLNKKTMAFSLLDSAKNGLSQGYVSEIISSIERQLKYDQFPYK